MISTIDTISRMVRLVYGETGIKPTKLFIGPRIMMSINTEIIENHSYSMRIDEGSTILELTVSTRDQFGNIFPEGHLGVE